VSAVAGFLHYLHRKQMLGSSQKGWTKVGWAESDFEFGMDEVAGEVSVLILAVLGWALL
jgi:hypothetical protein